MKRFLSIAILCGATAALAVQQTTDTAATKPPDSPLVKAAKASGGPKRKPKTKVITNADVKKSGGKLVTLPTKNGQQAATQSPQPQKGSLEKQDEQRKAAGAVAVRVSAAEKKVSELEKELRRLEDAYYAENDPNYRDSTIEKRFNQTKQQLEDARKELADARDAEKKVKDKPLS